MHTEKRWRWLGQGLVLVSLSLALAGCGGASGTGSTGAVPSSSIASAPSVSGTPPATVAANNRYSFQPTLANPAGKPVSFSILNKPLWASFGLTSGELSGIPNAPQAGTYANIIISASDGTSSSALPAFSIQVTAPVSPAATSVSASGTMIPSATQIVDSTHTVWTLASGVIYQDGKAAAYSANVALLLYFGGTLYQQNKSCLWWSWSGSAWVASSNPAPRLTPACSSAPAGVTPPSTPPTSSTTPTGVFGIQVKGDKFVSAKDGSALQLVGTNISGLETGSNSRWASFSNAGSAFWSKVLDWGGKGINTVRLPLNEASWLNYTCYDSGAGVSGGLYTPAGGGAYTPDPNNVYQATVKKAVADATAAGLYVILDLHWGSPNNAAGQPLCPIGQPGFADADHSLTFWKSLADTFKANPAVMFELFNEPFGTNDYADWVSGASGAGPDAITLRNGGAYFPFAQQNNPAGNPIKSIPLTWHVAGTQAMLDTIRGQGATNVILSSPIGWAGEIETWLATQPADPIGQLGVAWHLYGYKKGPSWPQTVLDAGYPIVITETYGLGNVGGYGWASSRGVGYIWWGWNDWGGQPLSAELNTAPWFQSTAP